MDILWKVFCSWFIFIWKSVLMFLLFYCEVQNRILLDICRYFSLNIQVEPAQSPCYVEYKNVDQKTKPILIHLEILLIAPNILSLTQLPKQPLKLE